MRLSAGLRSRGRTFVCACVSVLPSWFRGLIRQAASVLKCEATARQQIMNLCILYTKSDETCVFNSATESGVKNDNQIWLPISLPYLVIKTVTTFGHQNGDRIWSSKRRPHLVITTQCKAEKQIWSSKRWPHLVIKMLTTFGHQNQDHMRSPHREPHLVAKRWPYLVTKTATEINSFLWFWKQFWNSFKTVLVQLKDSFFVLIRGQFLRQFQSSFGAVLEHCSPSQTLGNAYTILRNEIHMNSQSRTLRSNCVCQGGCSDSMTTGGLKNDDRNWPHHSAPQRTTAQRTAPYSRVWTFETTFHAQWKARLLMASTMLAEVVFFEFFFVKWWPAVPNHFARAGVVFESLNF